MSERETEYGAHRQSSGMNEAQSYVWTAQVMRGLIVKLDPSVAQILADRISAALLEAYKLGEKKNTAEIYKCRFAEALHAVHCRVYSLIGPYFFFSAKQAEFLSRISPPCPRNFCLIEGEVREYTLSRDTAEIDPSVIIWDDMQFLGKGQYLKSE